MVKRQVIIKGVDDIPYSHLINLNHKSGPVAFAWINHTGCNFIYSISFLLNQNQTGGLK